MSDKDPYLPWYREVKSSEHISQGDILFNCPIYIPAPKFDFSNMETIKEASFDLGRATIIVLSQACDLNPANGSVLDSVVVAQVDDAKGEGSGFVSDVLANRKPAYHALANKTEGQVLINYSIVDFSSVYTLPYSLLAAYKDEFDLRLRLNSPYLEFLAQRFGNYFCRVGIPDGHIINKTEMKEYAKID